MEEIEKLFNAMRKKKRFLFIYNKKLSDKLFVVENLKFEVDINDPQYDICPICHEKGETICKCPMSEMKCKNGHEWHYCYIHRCQVFGKGDHTKDCFKDCLC